MPDQSRCALLVTVHGTFASDASWSDKHSPVCSELIAFFSNRNVQCQILRFRWSGRNSIRARIHAGTELVDWVAKAHRLYRPQYVYVIAHSHGGSVVAYAFKASEWFKGVVSGVATLSTPWVSVTPDPNAVKIRRYLTMGGLSVTYILFLLLSTGTLFTYLVDVFEAYYEANEIWIHPFQLIAMVLAIVLCYMALAGVLFVILRRFVARILVKTEHSFNRRLKKFAAELDTVGAWFPKMAIVRVSNDEASLLLSTAHAFATVFQRAMGLVFGAIARVSSLVPRVNRPALFWITLPLAVLWGPAILLTVEISPVLATSILILPLACAIAVAVTQFGGTTLIVTPASLLAGVRSFRSHIYCNVGIEQSPAGHHALFLVNLDRKALERYGVSLAHSAVYASKPGTESIVEAFSYLCETG